MIKLNKKSQGITLNTIIIAVLGILVLVVLAIIFGGKLLNFGQKTNEIESSVGGTDQASCKLKCGTFNSVCIGSVEDGAIMRYYVKKNNYCNTLYEALKKCQEEGFVNLHQAGSYIVAESELDSKKNTLPQDINEVSCTS
ncbi:MAG: hypothetical protein ABGW69_01405 [Nanoarchaeota archaeon]